MSDLALEQITDRKTQCKLFFHQFGEHHREHPKSLSSAGQRNMMVLTGSLLSPLPFINLIRDEPNVVGMNTNVVYNTTFGKDVTIAESTNGLRSIAGS